MKKYIKPKIKAIQLDPEQAVLQVCQVGGAYFRITGSTKCFNGGPGAYCDITIKGVGNSMGFSSIVDAMPS